jgi:putative proteasome-type protease
MIAAAGILSATQSVINLLIEGFENPESKEIERLEDMRTMFAAAQLVGRAVRRVRQVEGAAYEQASVAFDLSFLFGGQIAGSDMRLFQIYAAGNFIECSQDMPFMQIGEPKYGKPILDRAVTHDVEIYDALKIGLISMDSTLKSNLGVGPPVDIAVLRRDVLTTEVDWRIEATDPYFHDLRDRWSAALRAAHMAIPPPPYENMRR